VLPLRAGVTARAGAAAAVAILAAAPSLRAQTILGRVLDDARGSPVAGAIVRLLDEGSEERAHAVADSLGRFTLAPPENGRYVLEAVRLGYERTRSPLLDMHEGGSVPLDLMMKPLPIGLEGFEVTVQQRASELLAPMGLTPARLGNRWIDHDFIESVRMKADIGSVIRWKNVAGAYVINGDNGSSTRLCIQLQRGRAMGGNRCALLVLNGMVVSPEQAALMDPDAFEAVAVLLPTEATTYWGTLGGGGAVLMWTTRDTSR
jgi:hypothetical protein